MELSQCGRAPAGVFINLRREAPLYTHICHCFERDKRISDFQRLLTLRTAYKKRLKPRRPEQKLREIRQEAGKAVGKADGCQPLEFAAGYRCRACFFMTPVFQFALAGEGRLPGDFILCRDRANFLKALSVQLCEKDLGFDSRKEVRRRFGFPIKQGRLLQQKGEERCDF